MLGWLLDLRDPVVRLARRSDRRAFIDALGRAPLVVLSLPLGEGVDAFAATDEELLALIEKNAADLAKRTEFPPFTYPRDGKRCLPLFSSIKLAQEFIGAYSRDAQRVFPFQALTVTGRSLRENLLSSEYIVVNARTRHERVLDDEDKQLIQQRWPLVPCS